MTIAVLGGRFDPPHWGHWWVARQVLDSHYDIDEVWFIPAKQHQWKQSEASGKDRLAMLSGFSNEDFKISDLELMRGGISYTIDTIKEIKIKYADTIYWIIGSDILEEFDRWEKRDELTKLSTFLVFPRNPYNIPANIPSGFEIVCGDNLVTTNLSSTIIRRRIKDGKSVRGFVPESVEKYIKEKGLYKDTFER